jgi:hypothetical protein
MKGRFMTDEQFKQLLAVQTAQVAMMYGILNNLRALVASTDKGKPAGFSFQDVAKIIRASAKVPDMPLVKVTATTQKAPVKKPN